MNVLALLIGAVGLLPSAVFATGESEESVSSEESISSVSEESSEESISSQESEVSSKEPVKYDYSIKEATISYRDSESASYAVAQSEQIGFYYLSADGWNEGDEYDIQMTIKGNITTKLESKIVYIYEYKPTLVMFNGAEVKCSEDRVYTLSKPAEKGEFDLSIAFTKTIVTNPVDLTHINWASLLTVQNMMTIGSWVVIVVGIIVLYAINQRYKKRGSTSLEEVKSALEKRITEEYGKAYSEQVSKLFDATVKPSFDAIVSKLEKVDGNQATLVRCLLLMQENTPEARLAITECLSKLDTSADEESAKVKAIIESQMKEYEDKANARIEAIEKAQEANAKWASSKEEDKKDEEDGAYDGTVI